MGKSVSSREVIRRIEADGWHLVNVEGSHHQFKHPTKVGRLTIKHPTKDMTIGVVKDIEKKTGLKLR
ncbi:MAG: type II toxin-antitoxin system HicA family toxin [Alphaproteobacteria bacterium]|nr:type II toxin-antitoxin system HicA family toxin [Alphaproteobacteria bacterium]